MTLFENNPFTQSLLYSTWPLRIFIENVFKSCFMGVWMATSYEAPISNIVILSEFTVEPNKTVGTCAVFNLSGAEDLSNNYAAVIGYVNTSVEALLYDWQSKSTLLSPWVCLLVSAMLVAIEDLIDQRDRVHGDQEARWRIWLVNSIGFFATPDVSKINLENGHHVISTRLLHKIPLDSFLCYVVFLSVFFSDSIVLTTNSWAHSCAVFELLKG